MLRILTVVSAITLVLLPTANLDAAEKGSAEPSRVDTSVDEQLAELSETLEALKNAYDGGEFKTFDEQSKAVLALAVAVEEHLLTTPETVSGKLHRAEQLHRLGVVAKLKDELERAGRYLRHSLALYEQASGRANPKIADVLVALSDVHLSEDQMDLWQELVERALAIRLEAYGRHHPKVAEIWRLRGHLARIQGNFADAESFFRKAIESLEKSVPPTHEDLAHAWNGLWYVLFSVGKTEEAAEAQRRAQEILEQTEQSLPSLP